MFADDVAVVVVVQTSNLALLLLTVVLLLRIANECELDGRHKINENTVTLTPFSSGNVQTAFLTFNLICFSMKNQLKATVTTQLTHGTTHGATTVQIHVCMSRKKNKTGDQRNQLALSFSQNSTKTLSPPERNCLAR